MTGLRRIAVALAISTLAGCGGGRSPEVTTTPANTPDYEGASPQQVDSLYRLAEHLVRRGRWDDAIKQLDRLLLEFSPGDARIAQARFWLGDAKFVTGAHLEAAREFRRVSDETPNDRLAPDALLRVGDVYSDLWRRPELDPTYGQTALSTYQELLNRYPNSPAAARAQIRIAELQERFAYKEYRAAIDAIQDRGISVNGCFITGNDSDTPDIFPQIERFVKSSGLADVQVTVLTPFPGTSLHARLKKEGRLLRERYWDRCTLFDVNFVPKGMSVEDLEQGLEYLMGSLYTSAETARRRESFLARARNAWRSAG